MKTIPELKQELAAERSAALISIFDAIAESKDARLAERVERRVEELRQRLFGPSLEVPLETRIGSGEKTTDQLARLFEQTTDSLDEELPKLVFLGAHAEEHPEILEEVLGTDEALADLYHEFADAPTPEELERYVDEARFEVLARDRDVPDLEDLLPRESYAYQGGGGRRCPDAPE